MQMRRPWATTIFKREPGALQPAFVQSPCGCVHLTRLPVRSLSAKYRSGDQVLEAIRDRYRHAKTQNDFGLLDKLQKQITETEAIVNEEHATHQELQRVTAEANERFKAAREEIVKRRDEAIARAESAPPGQADGDLGDSIQAELDSFPTTLKAFVESELDSVSCESELDVIGCTWTKPRNIKAE